MSIYTQLELDNRADHECIATCQGIALALKSEAFLNQWRQAQLQRIIDLCELRLKGDRRLEAGCLLISRREVKEWNDA